MRWIIVLTILFGCQETEIYVEGVEIHKEYRKCEVEVYTNVDGVEFYECIN